MVYIGVMEKTTKEREMTESIYVECPEPDEHPYRIYLSLGEVTAEVDTWTGRIRFARPDGLWDDSDWVPVNGKDEAEEMVRSYPH